MQRQAHPTLWAAALAALLLGAAGGAARAAEAPLAQGAPAGDAKRGKAVFLAKGCFQCHGVTGAGASVTGPNLAPGRLPYPAFQAYIRSPAGVMPPYSAHLLPDSEVADIAAYLRSIPSSRPASSIALLQPYLTAAPGRPPTPGEAVYRQSCAGCHGAELQGGVGPSLVGEAGKRSLAGTAALIKNPPPKMPKLHPVPLSDADVDAVSAYIRAGR